MFIRTSWPHLARYFSHWLHILKVIIVGYRSYCRLDGLVPTLRGGIDITAGVEWVSYAFHHFACRKQCWNSRYILK